MSHDPVERRSGPSSGSFDRRSLAPIGPSAPRALDGIVAGLRERLARAAGDGVELALDLRAAGAIEASPDQVERLLVALIGCARRGMPAGGEISIVTRDLEVQGGPAPRRYVELLVRDPGVGGAAARRALVEGAFAGLASEVAESPAHGTAVRLRFPRAPEPSRLDPSLGAPVVILADPSPPLREEAAASLRRAGYVVHEASDGFAALEAAQGADLDLLVLSVQLPRVSGTDVARRLTVDRPWVRVVFTSDSTPPGAGDAFLPRPFGTDELLARLAPLASMARRARPSRPGPCAASLASDLETTKKRYRPRSTG